MQSLPSLSIMIELSEFGYLLHGALAEAVGEDLAANIPVMIPGHLAADGPLRTTEMMNRTKLSSGGMTKAVDRLELADLIERSPDPDDRRAVLIGLTGSRRHTVRSMDRALSACLAESSDVVEHVSGVLGGFSTPGS